MSVSFKDWTKENLLKLRQFSSDKTWWVFVLHEPEDLQVPTILRDLEEVWWQLESGDARHRRHLQGVCRFRYPKSRTQLRAQLKGWWSEMRGTPAQAVAYCTKTRTRLEGPWHHYTLVPYFSTLEAIMTTNLVDTSNKIWTPFIGPCEAEWSSRPQTECLCDKPYELLELRFSHGVSPHDSLPVTLHE